MEKYPGRDDTTTRQKILGSRQGVIRKKQIGRGKLAEVKWAIAAGAFDDASAAEWDKVYVGRCRMFRGIVVLDFRPFGSVLRSVSDRAVYTPLKALERSSARREPWRRP